ncbi:hypothetical protein WH43_05885 [Rheinheimera sp. KL1]|uniref:DUF2971 domain-containing protein n=1 Tax=Rheinheimera sp. KL1 TaxID=1635005 RepID=UPI0006A976F7|nr:DUF2971 domain-containing protein [Rheinheimera sp. KL1]KOO59108.1 hypothetical protein WH43_05885 [Rheinheimera sp. KL1]
MGKELYRFRSIKRLIDNGELEKQVIYFASPEALNDPMEGYRDIYWSGDDVVWTSLFRHYLFCLHHATIVAPLKPSEDLMTDGDIPVFGSICGLATEDWKNLANRTCDTFLSNSKINLLVSRLSSRSIPVKRDELETLFRTIHFFALKVVFDVLIEEGIFEESKRIPSSAESTLDIISNHDFIFGDLTLDSSNDDMNATSFFSFLNRTSKKYLPERVPNANLKTTNTARFLLQDFPASYTRSVEKLCFPKWYAACFIDDYSNSSIWAHYGSEHAGVCLIFDVNESADKLSINLEATSNWSSKGGYTKSWDAFPLHRVTYKNTTSSANFFSSLGLLNIPTLMSMWYSDKNGIISPNLDFVASEKEWRNKYWEKFYEAITLKGEVWKQEREYRAIYTSSIFDLSEHQNRFLNYNFSTLRGVIFGMRIDPESKIKVIKILKEKCRANNRSDFQFYDAYFCSKENKIKRHLID